MKINHDNVSRVFFSLSSFLKIFKCARCFLRFLLLKIAHTPCTMQPYLEGGRLLFCCGVTFLGDSTSLVLSRLSRLALLMWVCRILVALSWNGLGRFVNIMDSSGAFRLNRSISTNWAAWKLKHEENEFLLATTNFYFKSWSSYYTLDDNRI